MVMVYIVHPALGDQVGVIPDDPSVIISYKAKGWVIKDLPDLDSNGPGFVKKQSKPEEEINGPGLVEKPDEPEEVVNGPGFQDQNEPDPLEINGPAGVALLMQTLADQKNQDQPQPPSKSTKKAAPSGDKKKEGVTHG